MGLIRPVEGLRGKDRGLPKQLCLQTEPADPGPKTTKSTGLPCPSRPSAPTDSCPTLRVALLWRAPPLSLLRGTQVWAHGAVTSEVKAQGPAEPRGPRTMLQGWPGACTKHRVGGLARRPDHMGIFSPGLWMGVQGTHRPAEGRQALHWLSCGTDTEALGPEWPLHRGVCSTRRWRRASWGRRWARMLVIAEGGLACREPQPHAAPTPAPPALSGLSGCRPQSAAPPHPPRTGSRALSPGLASWRQRAQTLFTGNRVPGTPWDRTAEAAGPQGR